MHRGTPEANDAGEVNRFRKMASAISTELDQTGWTGVGNKSEAVRAELPGFGDDYRSAPKPSGHFASKFAPDQPSTIGRLTNAGAKSQVSQRLGVVLQAGRQIHAAAGKVSTHSILGSQISKTGRSPAGLLT